MKTYTIEALLRPPIEIWPALTAMVTGGVLILAPETIMMTPSVAYAAAACLLVLATLWLHDALLIIRYQRGVRRMPRYDLKSSDVPVSPKWQFIGRGFEWEALHTQRLRDLRRDHSDYLKNSRWFRWARKIEKTWEQRKGLAFVAWLVSRDTPWNPVRPLPPVGGKPELHGVGLLWEEDVYNPLSERVGHTLVLGTTRVGKSQLAKLLVTQDIRRGDCTIVLDPKGDADLMITTYMEGLRSGRPVYLFHLGFPDISCRYNAVGHFQRVTEVATRIADQLPDEGNSAAFKEFGWRFVNIIAQALVAQGKRPGYKDMRRYINNIEPLFLDYANTWLSQHGPDGWDASVTTIERNINENKLPHALKGRNKHGLALMQYIQEQEIYDPVLDGLLTAFKYDKTYFDKIVSSLGPLLEKLTTGRIAELIAPDYEDIDDKRHIFDWESVIRQGATVYVGLDCLSDSLVGGAVGASMFADLTSVAGNLYKHGIAQGLPDSIHAELPNTSVHADEFNELVGNQFIPMVNKGGGAGFQVTAYTQTSSDVAVGIGNTDKAEQIMGNFNTLIMLRVKNKTTAEVLTEMVPPVQVSLLTTRTGANDNSDPNSQVDFTSATMSQVSAQDVPALEPGDVTQLPKGHAFALLEGGKLYKLRFPLVTSPDDVPSSIQQLAVSMKDSYTSSNEDWYQDNWHQTARQYFKEGVA